jgi:glycosyltransferase involved in cell wall biosynthesis
LAGIRLRIYCLNIFIYNSCLSDFMQKKKIIAVIPAYNEENYIREVVKKTSSYVDSVIVVDDGSVDRTSVIAEGAGAVVLRHPVNLGLGSSLKTGCEGAMLLDADIIVSLDGDGQHDADEIPLLLSELNKNENEIVFGERNFNNRMPLIKRFGNLFFSNLFRIFYKTDIKDTQTGFRAFTQDAYKKIYWNSMDYFVASEIIVNSVKKNIRHSKINARTIYHDNFKGTSFIDGIKILNKFIFSGAD